MPPTPGPDTRFTPSLFLVEEMSHRVLNEYTEAIGSLSIAASRAPDSYSSDVIFAAAERLQVYAEAHRALQAPSTEGPLDLAEYVAKVCASIASARLAECGVKLTVRTEEVWLESGRCWRVGLIIAELIRNAMRHGLSGRPGEVGIDIRERSGHVICTVRDSGGSSSGGAPGRGIRLMKTLAAELGGAIDWTFEPTGCRACLQFRRNDRVPISKRPIDLNP